MAGTPTRYGRDTFETFIVRSPQWRDEQRLELRYDLGPHRFIEQIVFPPIELPLMRSVVAPQLVALLAAVAGVSYFKASAPRHVVIHTDSDPLTGPCLEVVQAAYDEGLREFAFRNGLEIPLVTTFEHVGRADALHAAPTVRCGPVVTLGGGRDSALTAALLRNHAPELMTVGSNPYADRIGEVLGRPVAHVARTIAPELIELNRGAALNGHVPVTGINSLVAAVWAQMIGSTDVVMSNEASANRASHTTPDGHDINHQYSKSWAFEVLLRRALAAMSEIRYFSAIRPWGEVAVARAFSALPELHPVIMSCNRAFLRDPLKRSDGWCGECDKCRFVFLSLAPFMTPRDLTHMFGRNLLSSDRSEDVDGFAALFAEVERPWDCVGEPEEVRALLGLLIRSADWSQHRVVTALAERFGNPSIDGLSHLFALRGQHGIPEEFWAAMASAFAA